MDKKQMALSKDFPNRLKKLRTHKSWPQGQLAKKSGADLQRISKYEKGVQWATMEPMFRIAQAFEVSEDFLIRDDQGELPTIKMEICSSM